MSVNVESEAMLEEKLVPKLRFRGFDDNGKSTN